MTKFRVTYHLGDALWRSVDVEARTALGAANKVLKDLAPDVYSLHVRPKVVRWVDDSARRLPR